MKLIKVKAAAIAATLVLGGAALPSPMRLLAAPASQAQTIVLQHIVPTDTLKLLHWDQSANFPAGVTQVQAIPAQNALAVTATPAGLAKVREIVKILDIEPRQVQVKTASAYASDADLKASGLDFQLALLNETDPKSPLVKYADGSLVTAYLQMLTKQKSITQAPDVTTTNNATAFIDFSQRLPSGETDSTELVVTPRVNSDNSITMALRLTLSLGTVKHEISTLRTVKGSGTLVMVLPAEAASQHKGENFLLFVTPTVK